MAASSAHANGLQPPHEVYSTSHFGLKPQPQAPPRPTDSPVPPIANKDNNENVLALRPRSAPRVGIPRARSDLGPARQAQPQNGENKGDSSSGGDQSWQLRHGWDAQYSSEEYLNQLTSEFFMYYTDKRHETNGNPRETGFEAQDWRMKERLKTVSAILAICLNIGVDPPDVLKSQPSAVLECWINPTQLEGPPGHQPINAVGKALQTQYEMLSMRTRYRLLLDPTVEETKKYCTSVRRTAKEERILFHYNGHGVPRPTPSGEMWVFNKAYTQYIPIPLHELQTWLGGPGLFVWESSDAGLIIQNYLKAAEKHEEDDAADTNRDPSLPLMNYKDCIHLAACKAGEMLPTNPNLPADVFTSCLTTPIEMAVRFFILQTPSPNGFTLDDAARIPGKAAERKTPMGELNWIFTAITDSIAWNTLDTLLFKKLFRQDLMVAALFRNFLLAQRVMRMYSCHPQSIPAIPSMHDHSLWDSWDLAVEMILSQLPQLNDRNVVSDAEAPERMIEMEYQSPNFFAEQLTAFEMYLAQGATEDKPPQQLPVVLQVLLSQQHRLRALVLLGKFLDMGQWAVNLALGIGIFPYVLKLLQSQAAELKPVMVFIWARILAVDQSCQADLLKDSGYQYFVNILHPEATIPIANISEHRAMCSFIMTVFCKDHKEGRSAALRRKDGSSELIESCLFHLKDQNCLLRQWACLCISMLWADITDRDDPTAVDSGKDGKWEGIRAGAHEQLTKLLVDPVPEVRASMLHAFTQFFGIPEITEQVANIEVAIASNLLSTTQDGSSMVRREAVIFFSAFVKRYEKRFIVSSYEQLVVERDSLLDRSRSADASNLAKRLSRHSSYESPDDGVNSISSNTIFAAVWKHLLILTADPHPEVARDATYVVDYVHSALLQSALASFAQKLMEEILKLNRAPLNPRTSYSDRTPPPITPTTDRTSPSKQDGYFSSTMKRTASVAASLKNFAMTGSLSSANLAAMHDDRPHNWPHQQGRSRISYEWDSPPKPQTPYENQASSKTPIVPVSRFYKPRDPHHPPMLPLRSVFFEFCVEYFREPQMRAQEADEPGSDEWNAKSWRRNRNDAILAATQPLKEHAGSSRWDNSAGNFNNSTQPMKMCFHQFEDHLAVTDNADLVRVWDWRRQRTLSTFSVGNPMGTNITAVRFINEDDQALIMTGTSDGVLKVFRNYEYRHNVELVSAFRALTDMVPSNKNAGLVFEWLQGRGLILVAGDIKTIRVWNAGTEICVNDIPARSGSCVTSLTSDQVEGHVFVAGFGDGAVRVYDQRMRSVEAMVKCWKEHRSWITNVHLQRGGMRELVSGGRDGEIKLWDIRMDKSLKTIKGTKDALKTLSVHEHAPVFAIGSERHNIKVFNTDGTHLSSFEPYITFMHQNRSAPISATAFHPHRMLLACSAMNDTHINLFRCKEEKIIKEFE